ncbi:MAG: serine protease [Patescibacteria group bacterium]|jgi:hypothetical protein
MKKLISIKILFFLSLFAIGASFPILFVRADVNNPISAVAQITCINDRLDVVKGSGVIVSPDGKIITNAHVVASDPSKIWSCWGGIITKENSYKPDTFFNIKFFSSNITNDLAFGKIDSSLDGYDRYLTKSDVLSAYPYLKLNFNSSIGQEVNAVGYPGTANGNLNITKGSITSKPMVGDYNYLLSDVSVSYGNSGGAVVNKNGELLGLATSVNSSDLAKTTYILDVNSLNIEKTWLNKVKNANQNSGFDTWTEALQFIDDVLALNAGSNIPSNNQYSNNGTQEHTNYSSTLSSYDLNCKLMYSEGSRYFKSPEINGNSGCYCINNFEWNVGKTQCIAVNTSKNTNKEEAAPVQKIDAQLTKKLLGKILLQVESHGEAWYLNPKDGKRYYMANGDEAYNIMRNLGVGITNKDLDKIQNNNKSAMKYSGKIFLQVENKGEAYYVDFSGNLHYLKNGSEAYSAMRNLGLGITNQNLSKIPLAN